MQFVFIMGIFIVGCTKSGVGKSSNTTPPVGDTTIIDTNQTLVLTGTLIPSVGEYANGLVKVYKKEGVYSIVLEDFSSTTAPDVHIYLAQEPNPVHIIDLGNLKAFAGNQTYTNIYNQRQPRFYKV